MVRWLLLAALVYAGGRGSVAESYAVSNGKCEAQKGESSGDIAHSPKQRLSPATACRANRGIDLGCAAVIQPYRDGDVHRAGRSQHVAGLYTVVGGLFLFMLLLTAAVVSGAIG
ncbi:hypothetical protein AK812_SmicGene4972 [Symbiodinium microadriaticum]|uniref:Uncharacterized protein n=1 Tax=Symbiodinium microadriaticum TaxID=2951 RepID=A0A1Q9EUV3_SYMMI|nr:hypothetical protein AK812_SmicGene4972 [Symbiodinium microadriaticum]